MQALAKANEVRLGMAKLRGEIKAMPYHEGVAVAAQLLRDDPGGLADHMTVGYLLRSINRMGLGRARHITAQAHIPGGIATRIGSLHPQYRENLAVVLGRVGRRKR